MDSLLTVDAVKKAKNEVLGLKIGRNGDGIVIKAIGKGLFADSELKPGMQMASINGKSVKNKTVEEISIMVQSLEGEIVIQASPSSCQVDKEKVSSQVVHQEGAIEPAEAVPLDFSFILHGDPPFLASVQQPAFVSPEAIPPLFQFVLGIPLSHHYYAQQGSTVPLLPTPSSAFVPTTMNPAVWNSPFPAAEVPCRSEDKTSKRTERETNQEQEQPGETQPTKRIKLDPTQDPSHILYEELCCESPSFDYDAQPPAGCIVYEDGSMSGVWQCLGCGKVPTHPNAPPIHFYDDDDFAATNNCAVM
jgi:hypothetical protein